MQTFLPYPDFEESARVLDRQRLGKQRVEAMQLLAGQWPNHPASKMWREYHAALSQYQRAIILEWVRRGYKNTMAIPDAVTDFPLPPWLGDERVHSSHRANLLRKDPEWYGRYGWTEAPATGYYWP